MSLRLLSTCVCVSLALLTSTTGCNDKPAGCDGIADPNLRVNCRILSVEPLADDYGPLELRMSEIQDDAEHDMVALHLMVQHPSLFPILCPHIRTTAARERCERFQERPHLSERARRPEGPPPQ